MGEDKGQVSEVLRGHFNDALSFPESSCLMTEENGPLFPLSVLDPEENSIFVLTPPSHQDNMCFGRRGGCVSGHQHRQPFLAPLCCRWGRGAQGFCQLEDADGACGASGPLCSLLPSSAYSDVLGTQPRREYLYRGKWQMLRIRGFFFRRANLPAHHWTEIQIV